MHGPKQGGPLGPLAGWRLLAGAALVLGACRFASLRPLREAPSGSPTVPEAALPPLATLLPSLAPAASLASPATLPPSLTPAATLEPTPTFTLPTVPAASPTRAPRGSLRAYLLHPDLTYCTGGDAQLELDFYAQPEPPASPRPLVMFVHGGAWTGGDKAASGELLEAIEFIRRGYAFASINYRLAPQYVFPAMIEDVTCAVRFFRANAPALGVDGGRIGAYGSSAGGHLVSLLGTADATAGFEGSGGWGGQSSRVQAVANLFGPTDFTALTGDRERMGLALAFPGGEDFLRWASPVTYVSPDDPPFLLLQGELDDVVPASQAVAFNQALTEAGVESTLVLVRNAGHGFSPVGGEISPTRAELTQILVAFFDTHLR